MKNENVELLNLEIKDELESLKSLQLGTEEYQKTVDGVAKLMDRAIEMKKFEAETFDKETNVELKREQMEHEKRDSYIRNVLTAAGIGAPLLLAVWGTLKTFKFEETGTVTSIIGRGFINKLIPKK